MWIAKINGDRAFDMIVGTRSGKIYLILNSGISEEAIFCEEYDFKELVQFFNKLEE